MTGTMSTLCFFAVILAVYYMIPVRFRWGLLLAASAVFYASADWKMLFLIGGSIAISYYAGLKMQQAESEKQKKRWMMGCIILLVVILMFFKYFGFFAEAVNNLLGKVGLGSNSGVLQLAMPLGISYYTFKIISYLADIYKEKIEAEKHFGYYALYVSFFPQILCGPIERADHFIPQIKYGCKYEEKLASEGLERIIIGLFKKLAVADRLSLYVGTIFDAPTAYPGLATIMAVFFYSIQIYCDFSGYSDMAIGMAQMLGIRTRENFAYPYFSRSIKEFWTRWHISLSGWLKDYIYIPLGGNRKGKVRKNLNTLATFLVSGIWHGSSLSFVFWGGLHGLWNMISTPKKKDESVWKQILQTLITFCGVTFTWIFFRAKDLTTAVVMIKHAILGFGLSVDQITTSLLPFTGDNTCAAYFLIICLLILFLAVFEWRRTKGKGTSYGWIAAMLAITLLLGQFGSSSFLYGQY
ncbi:MAG: MBOAT family protein [Lachnospiraceae bacterium]|nr:MBOAT family protein [Lachnospiraceae bacterium]